MAPPVAPRGRSGSRPPASPPPPPSAPAGAPQASIATASLETRESPLPGTATGKTVRPIRMLPQTEVPEPAPLPPWVAFLLLPFATRTRTAVVSIMALVALVLFTVDRLIDSTKPQPGSQGGSSVYDPETRTFTPGGPIDTGERPDPGPAPGQKELRSASIRWDRASESLQAILEMLMAYARRYGAFPAELHDDLRELQEFGDVSHLMETFESGKVTYTRELSPDFKIDHVTLEAVPRGGGRAVFRDIAYRRPESSQAPSAGEPAAGSTPAGP